MIEKFVVFDSSSLVPAIWRREVDAGERFRVFNPSIASTSSGYAMCYRVVRDGSDLRWLATCQLDRSFAVVEGSQTPLSAHIEFEESSSLNERARLWHADPRYLKLNGRLYLSWNDGANRPLNHQFLMELTENGLLPAAPARELTCEFRRSVEKNWMLFEESGNTFVTYSLNPHRVMTVRLDQPEILDAENHSESGWQTEYQDWFGPLRGSAQPLRLDDSFLAIAHSSFKTRKGRVYSACFYKFSSQAPFEVLAASPQPFDLPNPFGSTFEMPKLNDDVDEVVYPCGIVLDGRSLIVSYGINDERCAIATLSLDTVEASLEETHQAFSVRTAAVHTAHAPFDAESHFGKPIALKPTPMMWWDATGKKFDHVIGERKFKTGNFGDIASKDVIEVITGGPTTTAVRQGPKLLCIGSIVHTAADGDIVWGSGMKGNRPFLNKDVRSLSVHAVRGPLTADMLRRHGIDISRIRHLFDPGCLLPFLKAEAIERLRNAPSRRPSNFKIIAHYKDDMLLRRAHYRHNRHFVSVDCSPMKMLEAIMGSDRVVSSSLHGIIFAESLGIPAVWLSSIGGEDDLKYYDYYYGTGRYEVKRLDDLEAALRVTPMPLPKFDPQAYLETFPTREVEKLRENGIVPGQVVDLSDIKTSPLAEIFSAWNFDRIGAEGIWGTAAHSRLRTVVLAEPGTKLMVCLTIRPFNHAGFKSPQQVTVTANECSSAVVSWSAANQDAAVVQLEFNAEAWRTELELKFHAKNCRSLRSLGIPSIEDALTICVSEMQVIEAGARRSDRSSQG